MRQTLFVISLLASGVCGCSLLVQFDPETQPCDSANACLSGYLCSDAGLCKASDAGSVTDAGGTDGSACTARETLCGDTRDNDCDGQTDCADTDCAAVACDDRDSCTTGEKCSGGSCPRGTAVICNTPTNPCQQQLGSCESGTGRCIYMPLGDGTLCGAGQAARCCSGTCINTTLNGTNCGGCGLACAMGQVCQPIDQTACGTPDPVNTSGRCTCTAGAVCPNNQACGTNGVCSPGAPAQCAPGQLVGAGVCAAYCRY